MKKTILVTGATGAQGGSVARALLAEGEFSVRILTRNANSEKAVALKTAGATVVEGNLDDIESLKLAMKDCYGVFGVTNFWEHFNKEYEQGRNLVDAVKEMGIQHFVLHTLPGYNKLSNGKYPTPHCDNKAALEEYTRSLSIPATFVQVAFYYENFFFYFPLQSMGNEVYSFSFPQGDTRLAMISIEDLGGIVAPIFNNREKFSGRVVGAVAVDENCYEYAAIMSKVLGAHIQYNYIKRDVFASFGFPGAEELANMFEVQRLYILNRREDLLESHQLNPNLESFESWVAKHKTRFESMMNVTAEVVS